MMSPDNRHKLAAPYWARPGLVTFAAPADGGGDAASGDDDDLDDDDDDDLDDDDPDEGKTPDELKAELAAARAALAKANGSSAKRRRDSKALKARIAELEAAGAGGKPKADDDAPDVDAVRKSATRAAEQAANERIIRAEARGALKALGVKPERVSKLVGLLELDEVDVDDDGEVDGLDDAIAALRDEYPELFVTTTRRRRSVAGDDDRDGSRGKPAKVTDASKLQAEALLGRGGGR